MKRLPCLSTIFLLSISVTQMNAATPPPTFTWVAGGGGAKSDKARAVTFDREDNVLLAGETTDAGTFGGVKREALGASDFFLAKASRDGTFLWVRSLGGTLVDRGYGVVTDGKNNIYVTGHYQSTDAKAGNEVLPNRGDYDIFLAKYSPDGDLLWIRTAGGAGYDYGHGIALDPAGDVVITGAVVGKAIFEDTIVNPEGKGRPVFCAKYSPEGTLRWAKTTTGDFSGSGHGIGIDGTGHLYIAGTGSGSGQIGDLAIKTTGGSALLLKLTPDGTPVWVKTVAATAGAGFHEISVDAAGRIWCAGMFKGSVTLGDKTWTSSSEKDNDGLLAHYSTAGDLRWSHSVHGPATDYCLGVANDGTGRGFVTGEFSATATFAGKEMTSAGATDIYTAAFSADRELEWCVQSGGEKGDNAYTMARRADGSLLIGGSCTAPAKFSAAVMESPGGAEAYAALLEFK